MGGALQAMLLYNKRKVDELVALDISATRDGREPDYAFVREMADEFSVPLAVGGGVRTIENVKQLLRSGADKVVIGTAFELIPEASHTFGTQAIVASIDHRGPKCFVRSGMIPVSGFPDDRAKRAQDLGAGEILLNNIAGDGTMDGYDLEQIRQVSRAVNIPVIACGGCSGYEDMAKALEAGASAVAAGALFQFTQATPIAASRYLKGKGFQVRI